MTQILLKIFHSTTYVHVKIPPNFPVMCIQYLYDVQFRKARYSTAGRGAAANSERLTPSSGIEMKSFKFVSEVEIYLMIKHNKKGKETKWKICKSSLK